MNLLRLFLPLAISLACAESLSAIDRDWSGVKSWVYQLTDYTDDKLDEIAASNFDLAVVDLARDGGSEFFSAREIEMVKARGKFIFAYFEVGAIENYRPEWDSIPRDLMAGTVDGWKKEQYVKYWDQRWWPVVKGRIDQALKAGFDGAYLDMITTYEEIENTGFSSEERARKMVDLIVRISKYAKSKNPRFKIFPQNCPELYTWTPWEPALNKKYIAAIDGIGLESVFFIAHDKPANKDWCKENRDNATAIKNAGKMILGVDYAKKEKSIATGYRKQREIGFVPYVSVVELNAVFPVKN